jgi:hypothetical protein
MEVFGELANQAEAPPPTSTAASAARDTDSGRCYGRMWGDPCEDRGPLYCDIASLLHDQRLAALNDQRLAALNNLDGNPADW